MGTLYLNSINGEPIKIRVKPEYSVVTGSTGGGGTITGATNGLIVSGKNIGLGGILTGNTEIYGDDVFLAIGISSPTEGGASFNIMPYGFQMYGNGATSVINLSSVGFTASAQTGEVSLNGSQVPVKFIGASPAAETTSLILTPTNSTPTFVIDSTASGFKGLEYGQNFSSNFSNNSLVDKQYVLGAKTYGGTQTFLSSGLELNNPANSFQYIFAGSAIAADRIVTMPLLTAGDTFVMANFAQTLSSKTLTSPVINTQISGTVTNGGNITTTNFIVGATATQTLTSKTLIAPQVNRPRLDSTSTVGQVWTATGTTGQGAWQNSTFNSANFWKTSGSTTLNGTGPTTIQTNGKYLSFLGGHVGFEAGTTYAAFQIGNASANPTGGLGQQEGDVYYNNLTKGIRYYNGSAWLEGAATANNGLTKVGINVRLGGTLTGTTTITSATGSRLNFAGFPVQYSTDLSASYNSRSLVDMGYVTGNTVLLTSNQTIAGKKSFTPTATLAGINIGSVASDPTTLSNGDFWLNSTGPGIKFQANNTAYYLTGLVGSANNTGRIPIETSNRGILTDASNLTFASNTLTAGNTVSIVGGSINSPGGGNLGISSAGTGSLMLGGSDGAGSTFLNIGAGGSFNFTSTNTPSGSSPDTGISRSAAGVLQINTNSKNGLGSLLLGGTGLTNSSVVLDIKSTTKAIVLTRTATANIVTPVNGMMLYDTGTHKFRGYANGSWVDLH